MSPTTGTPSIERPCLRGSSSTMTTGTRSASLGRRISRTIVAPASPAPTTATRVADRVSDDDPPRRRRRPWKRAAPIIMVARKAPSSATERGTGMARVGFTRKITRPAEAPANTMRRASATLACFQIWPYSPQARLAPSCTRMITGRNANSRDWYCDGMSPLNRTASSTRDDPATSMTSTNASGRSLRKRLSSRRRLFPVIEDPPRGPAHGARAIRSQSAPRGAPAPFSAVRSCRLSAHLVAPADDTGPCHRSPGPCRLLSPCELRVILADGAHGMQCTAVKYL